MSTLNLLKLQKRARCGDFNCLCTCLTQLGQVGFRVMVRELLELTDDEFDLVSNDIAECAANVCGPAGPGSQKPGMTPIPMSDCLAALKSKLCNPTVRAGLNIAANVARAITNDPNVTTTLAFLEALFELCDQDPSKPEESKAMTLPSGETIQASLSDRICGYWNVVSSKMGKLPIALTSALSGTLTSGVVLILDTCCVAASTGGGKSGGGDGTVVASTTPAGPTLNQTALKLALASAQSRLLRTGG